MRRLLRLAVSVALAGSATAAAQSPSPFEPTIVDLRINDQDRTTTLIVRRDTDGTLLVRADDLTGLRIKQPSRGIVVIDGERHVRLGAELGARVEFDETTQAARVTLPAKAFVETRSSAPSPDLPNVTPSALGAFGNYDLYGQQVGDRTSLGGFLDLGVFGERGVVTNSLLARQDTDARQVVRLDSTWTFDMPERLATLRVGDAISGAGAWGRSARFGGLQFGTNFATQPTLVTMPLLSAQGEAIVPSTVDVFVNGRRVASEQVAPGPFTIDRLPPITGAGQMQVVVTDALGRQQVVAQPYYTGQTLLRAGIAEYSFEAGAIREDYGLRSNAYGDLILAGTYRRGVTDRFTAEAHVEGQAGGASAAGVNAAYQVGNLGTVSLTAAVGGDGTVGYLGGAGFERSGQRANLFFRTIQASRDFAQLGTASMDERLKQLTFGGMGFDLGRFGNLQASYGWQSNWSGPTSRTAAISHALQIGRYGFLNLIASRSTGESDVSTDLFVNWTLSFGDRHTAALGVQRASSGGSGETLEAVASLQQSPPSGSGMGYFASVSSSDDLQLDYLLQGSAGVASAQYASRDGVDGWRAAASGGIAITQAGLMPARRLDRSFAVVEVADYPDVTIYVEHQPVGRTDAKGRVLLPSLRAYERNSISVDPRELPLDASMTTTAMSVTPAYRSGPVVRFPIERASAATLRLVLPDGTPVPAGASVVTRNERVPVAIGGFVYLTEAAGRHEASAEWPGHHCVFGFERPERGDPQPDLGTFTCRAVGDATVPASSGT